MSRRVSRSLAWLAGLFAAGQVALALAVEFDLAPARDPLEAAKWADLRALRVAEPDRPLLVMLGSSRTLQGFRPDLCDGFDCGGRPALAFNFGLPAAGPLRESLVYQRLRHEGIRPALLLVEVMPALLQEPGAGRLSEEDWLAARRLAGGDLARLRPYLAHPDKAAGDWLTARLAPAYSYRRAWCSALGVGVPEPESGLAEMDARGWQPLDRDELPPHQRDGLTRPQLAQYVPALQHLRIGPGPAQALRDLLAAATADRVPAVLVLMPENSAFRAAYRPEGAAELRALLDGLRTEFGAGVIDARAWQPDAAFWDGHHLLPGAATAFTRRLRAELTEMRHGG